MRNKDIEIMLSKLLVIDRFVSVLDQFHKKMCYKQTSRNQQQIPHSSIYKLGWSICKIHLASKVCQQVLFYGQGAFKNYVGKTRQVGVNENVDPFNSEGIPSPMQCQHGMDRRSKKSNIFSTQFLNAPLSKNSMKACEAQATIWSCPLF